MKVFDCHSDILNDLIFKVMAGADGKLVLEKDHLPRLMKGGVNAINLVVWVEPEHYENYESRQKNIFLAQEKALGESERFHVVHHSADFMTAAENKKIAVVLGMEGMASVTSESKLEAFYEKGVRHGSLTWNEANQLATGVEGPVARGLTALGKKLVKKMQQLGMLVDVSHLNEKSFWEVVDIAEAPIMASHSNCYALCQHPRNLKDDQVKAIADVGGMIGVNAWPDFVHDEFPSAEKLMEHVAHLADKVGCEHVAFGFDFCDFLSEGTVNDLNGKHRETKHLESVEKVPGLIDLMRQKGFHEKEMQAIAYENMFKRFQSVMD